MGKIIAEMAATIAVVPLCATYLPGIHCANVEFGVVTGLALAILYLLLRPIARALTGLIGCLTFGLTNILVDAGLVLLCANVMKEGFRVDSFWWGAGPGPGHQHGPGGPGRSIQKEVNAGGKNGMIALACDHTGIELKQEIKKLLDEMGLTYKDFGTNEPVSCDYPIYGYRAAKAVAQGEMRPGHPDLQARASASALPPAR